MIDQFVAEGILVGDNCCDFTSPLVIVNKKDGSTSPHGPPWIEGGSYASDEIWRALHHDPTCQYC